MKECFPAANIAGVHEPAEVVDAKADIDFDVVERRLAATITEGERLNTPRAMVAGRFLPGAEGVMMFRFGDNEAGQQLKALARAALHQEFPRPSGQPS